MIREVLSRRFKNNWPKPDLIVIDGGKGQLNAALSVLKKIAANMPVIAIVRELHRLYDKPDLKLSYIGPNDTEGLFTLQQEGVKTHTIFSGKLRRYFSLQNIVDILFKIPAGFVQSFFLLLFNRPKLIFSKGGSGSLAVLAAARLLYIPVFLHESDSVPGMSNQIASKWAKKIFISFEKTGFFNSENTTVTGNPTRKELLEGDIQKAKEVLGLTLGKPVLLFLGGSQGAQAVNDSILSMLGELINEYEIIHVTGNKNYGDVQKEAEIILDKDHQQYYHRFGSLGEVQLKHAYRAADLIISRAGAGSIFEIAACGKPSILIPLPGSAQDHQSKNAYQYAASGAAIVVEQENLSPNFFIGKVQYLLAQPEKLQKMKDAALRFSKPLAAKALAREILEYLQQ